LSGESYEGVILAERPRPLIDCDGRGRYMDDNEGCYIFVLVLLVVVAIVWWLDYHPGVAMVLKIAFGLVVVLVLGFLGVVVWALIQDSKGRSQTR